jgi:hypothetical protein
MIPLKPVASAHPLAAEFHRLEVKASALGRKQFSWWPDWRDECVAIIGSGPSVKKVNLEVLRDRIHVIAINNGLQLCPWADVLYSCDGPWWRLNKGAPQFAGLKLTHDKTACREFPGVQLVTIEKVHGDDLLLDQPSFIGAGGNSGFQAINLAVQFGATAVMLIGFDCSIEFGAHWHGRHPSPLTNPCESNIKRWKKAIDGAAPLLNTLGIDVINCSQQSALACYPKMSIEDGLARWGL